MGVHDVEHYPEIKRLLGIPEDEPIFILRAQDTLAMGNLTHYTERAMAKGCDPEFVDGMTAVQFQFANWREANRDRVKIPD